MKIINILGLFILTVGLLGSFSLSQAQLVSWNIEGYWNIGAFVQDGLNGVQMNITNESFINGNFTGIDVNNSSDLVWGNTTGSNVWFDLSNGQTYSGSIATDGTMSGSMTASGPGGTWNGWFWTISGNATPVSVPEPNTIAFVGIGLVCIANCRRRKNGIPLLY